MLKRKRLIIAVIIFIGAASIFGIFLRSKHTVAILMYHSVSPEPNPYIERLIVRPDTFEKQMRFLKERRYNVVPLEEVAESIKRGERLPVNTVAITFDDGFKDNYTYAFPILKKYNFPATVFLIAGEVSRPQGDRLSWDEIKIMQDSGLINFGSHTITHPYLKEMASDTGLRKEIQDSKKILESKLGREVYAFCYPGGRFNDKVREFVIQAGYKLAVASNPGKRFSDTDIFALKRIRISQNCDDLFVFWIETSGYYTFMRELNHKR